MWYKIRLPGFSYDFETDRYRSEMEARSHIRDTIAPKDTDRMIDYMRALTITPMWDKMVS